MKWLHLSDLHMRFNNEENESVNTLMLRDNLIPYLETEIGQVDFLLLSGDYRYAKDQRTANENEIFDWIRRIAEAVKISDLSKQVRMVAGNHDVQRSVLRSEKVRCAQQAYSPRNGFFSSDRLADLLQGFTIYDKLYQRIYGKSYINEAIENNNPHQILDMGNGYILLLNTVLISHDNADRGQLLVGTQYIYRLLQKRIDKDKPVIVLAHHGMNFLEDRELQNLKFIFSSINCDKLYLCGDAHQLRHDSFDNLHQITAGCLCQNGEGTDVVITTGEISERRFSVTVHSWFNNRWAIDQHFGDKTDKGTLWIGSKPMEKLPGLTDMQKSKLSPNFQRAFMNEIKRHQQDNRILRTPQVLLFLFKMNSCSLKRLMNAYTITTEAGQECAGEYLNRCFNSESSQTDRPEFDYNIDIRELLGLDYAEALLRNNLEESKKLKYATPNMIAYAVLSKKSNTILFIKEKIGTTALEEIKTNLLCMKANASYNWE